MPEKMLTSVKNSSSTELSYHHGVVGLIIKDMDIYGPPGGSDGKQSACNAEDPVLSLGQEDPLD